MERVEVVLRGIEREAGRRWLPIIGQAKARIIAEVVKETDPARALEVGTNVGYSGIVIASHMREGSRLTTIEVDPRIAREAEENIRRAGLEARVTVLRGDAIGLIPTIEGPIDFAFVDAEKSEYGAYLRLMEGKLHAGSVLVADNVGSYQRAMRDYLDRVRDTELYASRYIPVGWDGVEVSRKL